MKKQSIKRPLPPADLLFDIDNVVTVTVPALEVDKWVTETFLNEQSELFNEDHAHLIEANIGYLWTREPNSRHGKQIVGQAEVFFPQGGKWQKARQEQQIKEWFGWQDVDFIITLDANYCATAEDVQFCALVEHELYHCGQQIDEFGNPKFSRTTGKPKYAMRGHDIEEFMGVYRRYGLIDNESKEIAKLAQVKRGLTPESIAQGCGVCVN